MLFKISSSYLLVYDAYMDCYLIQAQMMVFNNIDLSVYFWLYDIIYKIVPTFHIIYHFLLCCALYYLHIIKYIRYLLLNALISKFMIHFKITIKLTLFDHDIYNQLTSNIFRFFKSQHDSNVMVGNLFFKCTIKFELRPSKFIHYLHLP